MPCHGFDNLCNGTLGDFPVLLVQNVPITSHVLSPSCWMFGCLYFRWPLFGVLVDIHLARGMM